MTLAVWAVIGWILFNELDGAFDASLLQGLAMLVFLAVWLAGGAAAFVVIAVLWFADRPRRPK